MSKPHWPSPLEEARALILKGDDDAAIKLLTAILNDEFFHWEALFMLGGLFCNKGLSGLAAVVTSAAIDARGAQKGEHFPEALMNLGSCYKAEHQNELAERVWLAALEYEKIPDACAKIMTNISGLYVNEAQPEKAIKWCDKALEADQWNWGARVNRGMAYLEMQRWDKGWEGFASTYHTGDRTRREYMVGAEKLPEWSGSRNCRVIVFGDQGIGDEIYFANSLPDMIEVSRDVILDCHPRLEALFRRSFPQAMVHGTRKHLSELPWVRDCGAEAAVGLADLPRFFRNRDHDWRGRPYLKSPYPGPGRASAMPLRIGLSWTGGVKQTRAELRSLPLMALEPILRVRPDAAWYSLQYTPNAAREVCELEEKTGIRISHYPGWVECYDYGRTASFVNSLDLIITVCTTVHHLGGALGVPTWTLVPKRSSWRYGGIGEQLPWYDSARLFRQEVDGDWSHPIARVAKELEMLKATDQC